MANVTCMVRASVWYSCELSSEDSEKVREYMKLNDCECAEAVDALYGLGEIALYDCSTESDFSTEEIEEAYYYGDDDDEIDVDEDEDVW